MAQAQTSQIKSDLSALQQTVTAEDYQKIRLPLLDGGLRSDIDPVDMQPNQVVDILNLTLIAGRLRPDTGYALFGTILQPLGFYGLVQTIFQVFNANGTSSLLLLTTNTVYQWVSAFNQWQLVPWGTFYTNTASVSAGGTTITLSSVTGLAIGSFLGLPLDDSEQLPVKITGIAGLVVTFDTPVPGGRSVPNTSNIVLGAKLNGNQTNQPCIVTFSPNDWTIFTNNVDPIFYFDGIKLASLVAASDLPVGTTCVWMIVFHESLYLMNTLENGVALPQRVRACDIANPLSWKPASDGGPAASIAAIYDLLDTEDFIQVAAISGPYLIIYRDTTIMRGTFYGLPSLTVFWEYMVSGEGTTTPGGVTEIGAEHVLVGNAGIYTYTGGFDLQSIGDGVYVSFLSAIGDLNAASKATLFCQYIGDYDELWILYPSGDNTLPNKLLRCNLEKTAWFVREFKNLFVSANPFLPVQNATWASTAGTWAANPYTWNSRIFLANVPSMLLCSGDDNLVYVYDYKSPLDNKTPIGWSVTSKDLAPGDSFQRWDSVRAYGQGNGVTVEYSTDGGQTFTLIGTLNFGTGPSLKVLTFQCVSAYIRFRLSGTDPTFVLNWLETWYLKESDW